MKIEMLKKGLICKGGKIQVHIIKMVFRAIFDLSNKIALLILLRMYALYVEKKSKKLKID